MDANQIIQSSRGARAVQNYGRPAQHDCLLGSAAKRPSEVLGGAGSARSNREGCPVTIATLLAHQTHKSSRQDAGRAA